MLDSVLDRRMGIPITLSVVLIEVGRRLGVAFIGIGAPGHFIVRDERRRHVPRPVQRWPCARRRGSGPAVRRSRRSSRERLDRHRARMLANLKAIYAQRGDADVARWVIRLRVLVAGLPGQRARRSSTAPGPPQLGRELGARRARSSTMPAMTTVEARTIDSEEARVNEAIDKLLSEFPPVEDRRGQVPRRAVRPRARVGALPRGRRRPRRQPEATRRSINERIFDGRWAEPVRPQPDRLRHVRADDRRRTAATSRRSATCVRCSPAKRSGASCSASRAPAPTSPASRRAACATATSGSSTVRRSGRRSRTSAAGACSSLRTDPDVAEAQGPDDVRRRHARAGRRGAAAACR